ncbi:3076_t:CDS:1, partial [Racocetra fulgida]
DILYHLCNTTNNTHIDPTKSAKNYALVDLQSILRLQGHSLEEFPPMPLPSEISDNTDQLIHEELNYNTHLLAQFYEINKNKLNQDQLKIFSA